MTREEAKGRLEPCPFCGADDSEDNACQTASVAVKIFICAINMYAYKVVCCCGAEGAADLVYSKAVKAWNTRAALSLAASGDPWMPIETAPKDGTAILLGYLDKSGKFAVRSAKYMPDIYHGRQKKQYPAWVCTMDTVLVDNRATHWMPLPVPPKHTEVTGGESEWQTHD